MGRKAFGALLGVALGLCIPASADITFFDVVVEDTLSSGATFNIGDTDIDFFFPDALVGDPVDPRRFGNLSISFEATSPLGIDADQLSLLGALSGTGVIFFNEVVEDMAVPGIIAEHNVVIDLNESLPYTYKLEFSRPSTHIKCKKTFFLSALDTLELDLAQVGFVEQNLYEVPEPASAVLLAAAGGLWLRRRR